MSGIWSDFNVKCISKNEWNLSDFNVKCISKE